MKVDKELKEILKREISNFIDKIPEKVEKIEIFDDIKELKIMWRKCPESTQKTGGEDA